DSLDVSYKNVPHGRSRRGGSERPDKEVADQGLRKKAAKYNRAPSWHVRMTARPRRLLAACVLGGGLVLAAAPTAAPAGVDAKEAELKQIRTRIESIRKSIHADAERRDALAGQLKSADKAIQSARERLGEIRAQRAATEQKLKALRQEQAETQRQVDEER